MSRRSGLGYSPTAAAGRVRRGMRYVSVVAPWRCDPQGPIKVRTYIWRPERRNDV